jgi:hypothetical protein
MNIYDRKERGLGATLMPALQALAMQNAKQLQDARKQWNFKEDFMKGGNLNEDQASLMSNTMMSDPKVAPLFLKVLGEIKNQEAMQKQGGLSTMNLPGVEQPGLEGVNKPINMLTSAPSTSLSMKDMLREERMEKNRKDKLSKEQRVEQHQIEKANSAFKKDMREKESKRKSMLTSLAAMKTASKSGNINSPFGLAAMNIGNALMPAGKNPFDYFKTPETQSFLTHGKQLFTIGKELFGSRITNADLPIIEAMLPNLMQNPETREMTIQAMEELQELAGKEYKIMNDIIAENGGKEPANLEDKVAQRFDKEWAEGSKNLTAVLGMVRGQGKDSSRQLLAKRNDMLEAGTVWKKNGKVVYRTEDGQDLPAKKVNGEWVPE